MSDEFLAKEFLRNIEEIQRISRRESELRIKFHEMEANYSLTLRDRFAIAFITGRSARHLGEDNSFADLVAWAYRVADIAIETRKEQETTPKESP